jgi:hypothetical protein
LGERSAGGVGRDQPETGVDRISTGALTHSVTVLDIAMRVIELIERLIKLGLERSRSRAARYESTMKWFDEVKGIV